MPDISTALQIGNTALATPPPDGPASAATPSAQDPVAGPANNEATPDVDPVDQKIAIAQAGARGKLEAPASPETGATLSSVAGNYAAGADETLYRTLGAPADIFNAVMRKPGEWLTDANEKVATSLFGQPPLTPDERATIQQAGQIPGSDALMDTLGKVGMDPRTMPANNTVERAARAGGSATVQALATVLGAKAIAPGMAAGVPQAVTRTIASAPLPTTAAAAAAGGATGDVASENVPEPYKGLADAAGNLIGGGLTAGGLTGARSLGRTAADLGDRFAAPFSFGSKEYVIGPDGQPMLATQGQQRLAGQRIATAASDPASLRDTLNDGLDSNELVPGSAPTTFQLTGDQGIGNLERAQSAKSPEPFIDRRSEQNAARVNAVDSLAPADSQSGAVSEYLTQRLADLDAHTDEIVQDALGRAAQTVQDLGGNLTNDQYGARLRQELANAKLLTKQEEGRLWNAVDPDGKLAIDVTPAKSAADDIAASVPTSAKPITGEEKDILATLRGYPDVQKFNELTALRGRLLGAIRDERFQNGETPALRRMEMLHEALNDTIATGADRISRGEQLEVAAGRMSPEDTILARFEREGVEWYAGRHGQAAADKLSGLLQNSGGEGGLYGRSNGGRPIRAGGPAAVPGAPGKEAGRSGNASGDSQVSPPRDLIPNFDVGAASRYRAAADATRERAQTFGAGPVGDVLRRGKAGLPSNVSDSQVAGRFFNSGKHSFEDTQAFLRAAGDRPSAVALLQDYAASSLRTAAEKNDGTLDPARFERWMGAHADALRAFPEVTVRFQNAAAAQRSIDAAIDARNASLESLRQSAARYFLGDVDPATAVSRALRSGDLDSAFAELARLTASNPEAREGLKRAVLEHIQRNLVGNQAAGETGTNFLKSDGFQSFVKRNAEPLRHVFGDDGVATMQAVAQDLQRTNRSVAGSRLPGGSNTAQDMAAQAKHSVQTGSGHGDNLLSLLVGMAVEHHTGSWLTGIAGAVGAKVVGAMRTAGLHTVDDLVTSAMLNPDLARTLLTKGTAGNRALLAPRLAAQISALSADSGVRETGDNRNAPGAGSR